MPPIYVGTQLVQRTFMGADEFYRTVFDAKDIRGKEGYLLEDEEAAFLIQDEEGQYLIQSE